MEYQERGRPSSIWPGSALIVLLVICVMLVSGCASSLPMPLSAQSQVNVDPSLMVEPNYTQTLLDFLSDKPSAPTPK